MLSGTRQKVYVPLPRKVMYIRFVVASYSIREMALELTKGISFSELIDLKHSIVLISRLDIGEQSYKRLCTVWNDRAIAN